MGAIRTRVTFANAMSVAAVFIALGGSAWAVNKNSVGSKQIKKDAVKNAKIADGAVTSPEVANGSLLGEDFAADQLPAGEQGAAGPQGPPGPTGPGGNPGGAAGGDLTGTYPNPIVASDAIGSAEVIDNNLIAADLGADSVGISEIATNGVGKPELDANTVGSEEVLAITEVVDTQEVPAGEGSTAIATCPAGQQILTGGFQTAAVDLVWSRRSGGGWEVRAFNESTVDRSVTAYAYCLSP